MALKHGVLIFIACLFSFWVGVYINTLHAVVLEGEGRLRVIGRNFINKVSESGIQLPPPQAASSFNSSMHGPLVRVNDDFSFITASAGSSCTAACEHAGMRCSARHFAVLNSCKALGTAFGSALPCALDFYGPDLPAALPSAGILMTNSKPSTLPTTCNAANVQALRLCPCAAPQPYFRGLHDAVADVVTRQLENGEANVFISRQYDASKGHAAICTGASCPVTDAMKTFDLTKLGLPSNAELLKSIRGGSMRFSLAPAGSSCHNHCIATRSPGEFSVCARHWLEVLNSCDALQAAVPGSKCEQGIQGRDLPAYRSNDNTVLVNANQFTLSSSCGSSHPATQRLCACGSSADAKGVPSTGALFHTIFNVQATRYFEWQSRHFMFWAKQANQPGEVTRLLSSNAADHLMDTVKTHISPAWDMSKDSYLPYNKPMSIIHWLQNAKPQADVIVIMDPDCLLFKPLDIVVEQGHPIGQKAFFDFHRSASDGDRTYMDIFNRYCSGCTFVDPIAVPVIIHRKDLERIAPLWLSKTALMRSQVKTWPNSWNNSTLSKAGLEWTAEMFAYLFAAAELRIRHDIWDLQLVPPVHTSLGPTQSVIHYHVEFSINTPGGAVKWFKQYEDAGSKDIWPISPTNPVTDLFATKMHEARSALPPTGHDWKGIGYFAREQ